jgi:hypothetical protein
VIVIVRAELGAFRVDHFDVRPEQRERERVEDHHARRAGVSIGQ